MAWSRKYLQSHTNQSIHQQTGANSLKIPNRSTWREIHLGLFVRRASLKCFVPQKGEQMVEKMEENKIGIINEVV